MSTTSPDGSKHVADIIFRVEVEYDHYSVVCGDTIVMEEDHNAAPEYGMVQRDGEWLLRVLLTKEERVAALQSRFAFALSKLLD